MNKVYVGLDLSFSATGVYMIRKDEKDISFEISSQPNDFSNDVERADCIAKCILERMRGFEVPFVALEDYFCGRQPGSVIKLAILGTVVRLRLLEAGYAFMAFAPTQIKKFETGSGVAPKDTMLKSVFKKHDFDTTSNNQADACAIAFLGRAFHDWRNGSRSFLKYESEVLKKIDKERDITFPTKEEIQKLKIRGESLK